MDEKEMVREKDEVGESETESLQDKERAHLQYVEMANGNDTKEALTDISMVSTILFIATMYIFASGMRSFLIPPEGGGGVQAERKPLFRWFELSLCGAAHHGGAQGWGAGGEAGEKRG